MCNKGMDKCKYCKSYSQDLALKHDFTGMRMSPCGHFQYWEDWDKSVLFQIHCQHFTRNPDKCQFCESKLQCITELNIHSYSDWNGWYIKEPGVVQAGNLVYINGVLTKQE